MEKEMIERLPFFPHLTEKQKRSFLENAERVRFQAGETIYSPEQ